MSTDREVLQQIQSLCAAQLSGAPPVVTTPFGPPPWGTPPGPTDPAKVPAPAGKTVVSVLELVGDSGKQIVTLQGNASRSLVTAFRFVLPAGLSPSFSVSCASGTTSGSTATYEDIWISEQPGGAPLNPDGVLFSNCQLGVLRFPPYAFLKAGTYYFNVAPDATGPLSVHRTGF